MWARPWVSVLLFVVKFVLTISPVTQVRTVMVAIGPVSKQAQKRQATCPRSQSQQAMGLCSAVLPLVGTLTSAGPCFLPRCRVHSRPPRVSREIKCRNARSHQPLQGSLGMWGAHLSWARGSETCLWEHLCPSCSDGSRALEKPDTGHPGILLVLAATQKVTSSRSISLQYRAASAPPLSGPVWGRLWSGGFFSLGKAARARGAAGGRQGEQPRWSRSCRTASWDAGGGGEGCVQGGARPPAEVHPCPHPTHPGWSPLPDRPPVIKDLDSVWPGASHLTCLSWSRGKKPSRRAQVHILEERMVNMSQVVALCLPFTHTHHVQIAGRKDVVCF